MKQLLLIISAMILASCALDIDYHMPANRFDTPEVSGDLLKGKVEGNLSSTHKVTLGAVYADAVFNSGSYADDDQEIHDSATLNFAADLGLASRLDIFYRGRYDSTDIYGAKLQVYGSGRAEKKEGLKIAVTAGYGREELDSDEITVANSDDTQSKRIESLLKTQAYDTSLIVGYRLNDSALVYLNNYYTHYDVDGHVTADDGTSVHASGISHNYGSMAGIQLGNKGYITVEGGYSRGTFETLSHGMWAFGVASGFAW